MAVYQVFKETALPGSLVANAIYLIAPAGTPNYLEIYVTNNTGAAHRHTPTITEIQALIDSSVASVSSLQVVSNIAARNALTPTTNTQVLVLDATGDATVASGAATYLYRVSNSTWYKISEAESQDVTLAWANIVGKPTSSAAAIDSAVGQAHAHSNMTQLNQIGVDGNGDLTFNSNNIRARLESTGW